jgi:hypothetical protein
MLEYAIFWTQHCARAFTDRKMAVAKMPPEPANAYTFTPLKSKPNCINEKLEKLIHQR